MYWFPLQRDGRKNLLLTRKEILPYLHSGVDVKNRKDVSAGRQLRKPIDSLLVQITCLANTRGRGLKGYDAIRKRFSVSILQTTG